MALKPVKYYKIKLEVKSVEAGRELSHQEVLDLQIGTKVAYDFKGKLVEAEVYKKDKKEEIGQLRWPAPVIDEFKKPVYNYANVWDNEHTKVFELIEQ